MRRWLLAIALVGCGKTAKPEPAADAGPELPWTRASVTIYEGDTPAKDRVTAFHDADGSVLAVVRTGADGKATGPIPLLGRGMVTVQRGGGLLTVTGVGPNANIVVGDRPGVDAGAPPAEPPPPPFANPRSGKLVITHPPAGYTSVRADIYADDRPDGQLRPRDKPLPLAAETTFPYALARSPQALTFRIELSSATSDRIVLARRMTIVLAELDIDVAAELPAQVSNATVEAGERPTIRWTTTGDASRNDAAVYQLGRWVVLAAPGATSFQFPALPFELAGGRPDANAKPGVALVEASDLGGYTPDRTDWLRHLRELPTGRGSYRIALSGDLTL